MGMAVMPPAPALKGDESCAPRLRPPLHLTLLAEVLRACRDMACRDIFTFIAFACTISLT